MKKRILFLIVTVLLFSFSLAGCTTEFAMDRYLEHDAPLTNSQLAIFPSKDALPPEENVNYRYICKSGFLFDDQMFFLQCKYSEESYFQEISRFASLGAEYREDLFDCPAYVMLLWNDRYYEYALLDDENFFITYFAAEASDLKVFAGIPEIVVPKNIDAEIWRYDA